MVKGCHTGQEEKERSQKTAEPPYDQTYQKLPKEEFQRILEAIPDAILIINKEGIIIFINNQTEKIFNYKKDELLGQPVEILIPEPYRSQHPKHREDYFSSPHVRPMGTGMELYGMRKNGEHFPVEISLSPFDMDQDKMALATIHDITDRKRFERTLQEKNIELENANLEKDRFLARINHELKTPLNAEQEKKSIKSIYKKHLQILNNKLRKKIQQLENASDRTAELTKTNQQLAELAIRDPLTGLFNRRYLEESLKRELSRAKRKKTQLAVFMIDIDNFKDINDEFGHRTGDSILRLMSQCLTDNIRQEDIACRYGGEEFTIILLESSEETAWNRAETLRKSIENLSHHYKKPIAKKVTVSIGISLFPQHGQTAKALINAADRALYSAKNQNRNQVVMSQNARTDH